MSDESIIQLAECIGRHILAIRRDGLANSQGHVERIDEDARAIHAIVQGEPCEMPLHGF